MSRSYKSKDAQRAHQDKFWLKAFGYDYDYSDNIYGYTPMEVETKSRFGWWVSQHINKRQRFVDQKYTLTQQMCHSASKGCLSKEDRKLEAHIHRAKMKVLITRFMKGITDDVIATPNEPRNGMFYW